MKANIIIADEHTIIRRGMVSMMSTMSSMLNQNQMLNDLRIVGDTDSPSELMTLLAHNTIDLLFLGFSLTTQPSASPLSGMDGLPLIKWINRKYPQLKIVVVSPFKNTQLIRMVLNAGAKAYISRDTCEKTLARALTTVLNNEVYIQRELMDALFSRGDLTGHELSPREIDVLRLLCKGMSLTDISHQLNLSNKTISAHKLRAMEKLDVKSDCQLYCLMAKTQMFDIAI
jgi:two-component system capsular synthesis response regulator RcsB